MQEENKDTVEELQTPDQVKNMVTALSRLAAGAGKKTDAGRSFDICTVEENMGYAFNGVVYTRVPYPFGFTGTVSANLLRSILSHLTDPLIKETPKSITLRSRGKTFRLSKLPGTAFKPPEQTTEETTFTPFNGGWLRKVVVAAPTVAGYNAFPGVWAGSEGYVACEMTSLGYVEADGPSDWTTIIPRELVKVLPSAELKLCRATWKTEAREEQELIRIVAEDGSDWHAPTMAGRYPDWKGVLGIETDREATIACKDLQDALRAVTLLARTGWVEVDNNICSIYTNTTDQAIAADGPTTAKASFETEKAANKWIRLSVDLRKLLSVAESIGAQEIKLLSTEQADRLFVKTATGLPMSFVLAHRRGVQDRTHAYTNEKPEE